LQQQSANFSVLLKVAQLKPSAKVALLTQAATGHPSAFQTADAGAARRRSATMEGLMAVNSTLQTADAGAARRRSAAVAHCEVSSS